MKDKICIVGFLTILFVVLFVLAYKNTESSSFWKEFTKDIWRFKFGNSEEDNKIDEE